MPDEAKRNRDASPEVPYNQRLGWRPMEFAAMIGVSRSKVWEMIKDGTIETVNQDGIKIIPRSYAIKAGYLPE